MDKRPLIECVLNLSEGRDHELLQELFEKISSTPCRLAHTDIGVDAHRSVLTLVGTFDEVIEALELIIKFALGHFNIATHQGAHPRVGILDVIPFVPLRHIEKESLEKKVDKWADEISAKYNLPIVFYGDMSRQVNTNTLAQIRKGGLSQLVNKIEKNEILIDHGPSSTHPLLGVSCVTVRDIMVAYNINLTTSDMSAAKKIARDLRSERKTNPQLKNVRFLAWWMDTFDCAQISTNIYNIHDLSMLDLFKKLEEVANKYKVSLNGSELIGLAPSYALAHDKITEDEAITILGLGTLEPFYKSQRLLDRMNIASSH